MKTERFFALGLWSILLTAVTAAGATVFGGAILASLAFDLNAPLTPSSFTHFGGELFFIWMVGTLLALLPSIFMSLIEWPLSLRLAAKPSGGWLLHMFLSIVFSQVMVLVLIAISIFARGYNEITNPAVGDSPLGIASLFALGGLTSSIVWHLVFVRKVRGRRNGLETISSSSGRPKTKESQAF